MVDLNALPADLPIPKDDGAADHLVGMRIPALDLASTGGQQVALGSLGAERTVIYVYPLTGRPGEDLPVGWDDIPGARGCTPEACSFRDHFAELRDAGAHRVFGLSRQTTEYQSEVAQRLHLPFELLSDAEGHFGEALGLPVFHVDTLTLYRRITLILRNSQIEKVFYPVFPPDRHAEEVLAWLQTQQ
ncbi:MAG: peroxiredoxin [Aurantimicrobium sp.]|nr:peroxiredoxin [Aurantimicrobium sp.]